MKRLSIIVPIFNVEKYLLRCLDSLYLQDIPLNDYEVLVINDGSTDTSLELARSYLSRFQNLKLFNQENIGVGSARNKGIREANGKYLFFVDADDFIEPNCLKKLLECLESKKLDLLRFNYKSINSNGLNLEISKKSIKNTIHCVDVVDGNTFLTDYLGWICYVWLFFYDTSFIKKNSIFFNETMYFEDIDWMVRMLPMAKRVQSIDYQVYYYYRREGSITKSLQLEKKNKIINDKLQNIITLKQLSKTTNKKEIILWYNGMISLIVMSILAYAENEVPKRKKEIISFLYKNNYFPIKSFRFTFKQKVNVFLINLSPRLYCLLKYKK